MLGNYFLVALRTIRRHPLFSFINIFGLALSLSFCMLVVVVLIDQLGFDTFHDKPEDVYRVLTIAHRKNGGTEPYASSPQPLGATLGSGSPVVETWTTMTRLSGEVRREDEALRVSGYLTSESFFDVFRFQFSQGGRRGNLAGPTDIILTSLTADRLFGDGAAMGKTVDIQGYGSFVVTGVLAPFPGKTHLEFDFLASASALPTLEASGAFGRISGEWRDYYRSATYVRLRSGARPEALEPYLRSIPDTYYGGLELETRDAGYSFELQCLTDITPGRILSQNYSRGIPSDLLAFVSILALIGMMAALFNYTMLTLARAVSRAKEVGIRKVSGAVRSHLIGQFVLESIVVMAIALLVGEVILRALLIPGFSALQMTESFDLTLSPGPSVYVAYVLLSLVFGVFAGIIPATILSGFRPVAVLKGLTKSPVFSRFTIRKALIVVQFVLSLTFVIVLTIMSDQIQYAMRYEYAFARDGILSVQLQGNEHRSVAAALASTAGVEEQAAVSHHMGTWEDWKIDLRTNRGEDWSSVRVYSVSAGYLPLMGIKLLSGINFSDESPGVSAREVLVNEAFLDRYSLGRPEEALNKTILLEGDDEVRIAGVMPDFLYKPLTYKLEPLMLVYRPDRWGTILVKTAGSDPEAAKARVLKTWHELDPSRPARVERYDDILTDVYSSFTDIVTIVGFLSAMAFVISMLGLLGIVTLNAESRVREVGIRKVLGASVTQLILLLSRREAVLLVAAAAVAIPLALFIGDLLLTQFAYRIPLGPAVVVPGVLFVLLIAACIVGTQTLRASRVNPVNTIHYE